MYTKLTSTVIKLNSTVLYFRYHWDTTRSFSSTVVFYPVSYRVPAFLCSRIDVGDRIRIGISSTNGQV